MMIIKDATHVVLNSSAVGHLPRGAHIVGDCPTGGGGGLAIVAEGRLGLGGGGGAIGAGGRV